MVADLSPSEIPTPAWPLLNTSRFDLRQPVPIGQAINGGPVGLRLFSTDSDGDLQAHHGIVFGETGSGKSNLARLLVLAAVLDPAARVHVAQKAGSKDFRKLAPVLDWLGDITDTERVTGMLRDAVAHMRAVRAGQTPEVPYLVVLEEAQNVLASKGSGCNPEIKALTKTLLAEGRDASICVVIVTQRPTSASVDQDVAQRPPNRLAFTVNGHTDADLAMGAKLNDRNNPMAAPQFAVGVHINGSLDAVVMVPEVSGKDVERIAGRATPRAAEPAAQPVATETPGRPDGLLDHALSVGAEGAETDRASIRYLLVRMQAAYPDIYDTDEWKMRDPDTAELIPDPGKLTKALRRAGVNVSTIKVDGKPARGCYLVDVMRAMSPTPAP